ncbi:uncharacterized protein [Pyxicephalus adspersus]
MEKDNKCVTEMILNFTLEIIYLLTGEDYGPVKKSSDQHVTLNKDAIVSEWKISQSPIIEPPPPSLRPERNKKIKEIISKITELLTEEVPIRCQDVTIFFSMEEWEYLKEHKDLYKDVMMENHKSFNFFGNKKTDGRNVSGITSQNRERNKSSPRTYKPKHLQDSGKNITPMVQYMENVYGHGRNAWPGQDLPKVMGDTSSLSREKDDTSLKEHVFFEGREKSCLLNSVTDKAEKQIHPDCIEETLSNSKPDTTHREGQTVDDSDMCLTVVTNTFFIDTEPLKQMSVRKDNPTESQEQTVVEKGGGVKASADLNEEPKFTQSSFNEKIVFNLHRKSYTGQNGFVCSECGEHFSKNSQLVEHHRLHSTEKPFACPECGKQFAERANVIAHQLIHIKLCAPVRVCSSGEVPVVCSECGMTFVNSSAFEEHQKLHRQEKPFVCLVCNKSFTRKGHLSNHKKIHNGGKEISYTEGVKKNFSHSSYTRKRSYLCPECGKCFPSRCHLDRHQRVHTGEKPFSCTECDKRFTDRSGLVIHQRIHTGEKPYKCDQCEKQFRDRSGLVVHQRTHTGEQPFRCLQCGKCFHNRTRLEHHKNTHAEEKAFTCPQCDHVFLDVTTFALHHQTHYAKLLQAKGTKSYHPQLLSKHNQETPQLFLCPECGESFEDPSVLALHIRTHQINQTQSFSEPTHFDRQHKTVTVEVYQYQEGQQSHQFSHQNVKGTDGSHSCFLCKKSFPDLNSLMAHEQQHSEEKPYKCAKCGECFVLKGYLMKHLETHE